MTEASGGGGRAEMERRLIQRSMEDEDFRRKLLEDPKAAVEQELGRRLPEAVAGGGDYSLYPPGDCVSFPTDSRDPDQTDFC